MEETNDRSVNIEGDGESDNIVTEQHNQPNEQDKELNLSEFPKEFLEQILIYLDNKELLTASHVCKSFATAAEMAFAQKYSKECYSIDEKTGFERVMLTKYGEKMRTILMEFPNDELQTLIEQKCCSLKSVEVYCRKMPMLKGLKKITLNGVNNLNAATLTDLINDNPELEFLHICSIESGLLVKLDDRLNMLKNLKLESQDYEIVHFPKIKLKALETLDIFMTNIDACTRLLRAMNCNPIKVLKMQYLLTNGYDDAAMNDIINEVCSIKTLVSFRLDHFRSLATKNQLQTLAVGLPHLTELGIRIDGSLNLENEIVRTVSIFPNLKKLILKADRANFEELLNYLETSINEFHACFTTVNTEIEVNCDASKINISKYRIYICDARSSSVEVYWMNNFNVASVRKVIESLESWNWVAVFKFVNNCADQTIDISTFMHSCFVRTECLDIESNGPITVNANATRYPGFFPHLQSLYVHLDNDSAIDFLQKCDINFCKHIVNLRLNKNSISANQEQWSDMTSILAKFEHLKSLHYKFDNVM